LQITLVRPAQIVAGKLGASVAWLLLLVVAAVPIGAIAFFLGGVSLGDLLRGLVTLVVVAVSVAAVSLGISSLTRKTTASVVLTYGLVLTLMLGTLFAALVESAVKEFQFDESSRPVALYANPFYGLADAVRANSGMGMGGELPSVLTAFGAALPNPHLGGELIAEPMIEPGFGPEMVAEQQLVIRGGDVIGGPDAPRVEREPVWLITMGVHVLFGALGFLLAARRVRPEAGPRQRRRRGEGEPDRPLAGVGPGAGAPGASDLPPPSGPPVAGAQPSVDAPPPEGSP
ncbi:MAG: hypothetical protein KY457_15035, partial [Actinobacteria bacterium]|nr:hypothetical protein [Actinomycetota bacterium]